MLTLLVDQEQFSSSSLNGCITALFVSLFHLFAVQGILLNTISADLVGKKEPPVIDSLDDLIALFYTPVVIQNFPAFLIFEILIHKLHSSTSSPSSNQLNFI